jgi:hypothetical protein
MKNNKLKLKIVDILIKQQYITSQGIHYRGEKDWALNEILNLFDEYNKKGR